MDTAGLAPIEEIIEEARNGRMYILVDDEDRENEGDLIIPAQVATPQAINFMAQHGRGLVCLALTEDRCETLQLEPMARENKTLLQTAFTVSIEAKDGVDTGISAADRARTISVAISCTSPDAIVSPGHVFPLRARKGGVLIRAGHTEAAVDVSRLAGLNPSGVICEIMKEDGTMARMPDLIEFAKLHDLKIGTIRDLIRYRCQKDHIIKRGKEVDIASSWGGNWHAVAFSNLVNDSTAVAMVLGDIDENKPSLVRMHALDVIADAFGSNQRRPSNLLQLSIEKIAKEGSGIIVLIGQTSPQAVDGLLGSYDMNRNLADMDHLRDYGFGAQVLMDLGVHEMVLLSNSNNEPIGLDGYGLSIIAQTPLS